ncbi:MAG: hypothetical protein DMD47_01475 [Gemmatimonadetes bacterium]|nr:MAG: hypothetical protein DMD47_01475 [Gemmatimonadota bacterium]
MVRSPATPQRAPTRAAAAACCQRSSSGTRNVTRCGSRKARPRSSTASRRRSTCAKARSSAAPASPAPVARRPSARASQPTWSRSPSRQARSKASASALASSRSRASVKRQRLRIASIGTKKIIHAGLENQVETRWRTCGTLGITLRFPTAQLNLAARPADTSHAVPGGLLGKRPVLLGAALWLAACSQETGPIIIGVAGPFSQPRGVAMRQAAELAAAEINAKGGVKGRPLRLRVADDSGREDTAVRVAEDLYREPDLVAVVGHLTSGTTIAAARVYGGGASPVPVISPSASSPDLSGINPYFFRVCPTDLSHGPELARFARQSLAAKRAGILYINNDYGRGIRKTFAAEFTRLGGVIVEADPYVPATPSLEPYLSHMRLGGADVLVLATERPGAELALRELQALGLRWPVIGGDALTGIEADGPLAAGVHVSSAYLPDRPDERNRDFVAAYARAYQGQRPDHRGAGAYDIVRLLARAIQAGGPDRQAIRDYLVKVGRGRPAFDGVTGAIAFDEHGDVAGKSVTIGVVQDGQLVTERGQGGGR